MTANEDRTLVPLPHPPEPSLRLAAGASVTRKINLTPLFPVTDLGVYHVRANVFFADLNKFFYAHAKVFEVTSARPIWQQTVGDPASDGARTYSLMTNRFPDHTSLYVRVEDKENSLVYATYSLGRVISFDEPHAEVDRKNQLHVLQPSAPRLWSYSVIDLNGRLLKHSDYAQTRSIAPTAPRRRRHRHSRWWNAGHAARAGRRGQSGSEVIRSAGEFTAGRLTNNGGESLTRRAARHLHLPHSWDYSVLRLRDPGRPAAITPPS